MKLILPLPPTVNHYWIERVVPAGRGKARVMKVVSPDGKAFRKRVEKIVDELCGSRCPFGDRRLSLRITLHFQDARDNDLDNRIKPLFDALKRREKEMFAGLFLDDEQIDRYVVQRGSLDRRVKQKIDGRMTTVVEGGRCEVQIAVIATVRQLSLLEE